MFLASNQAVVPWSFDNPYTCGVGPQREFHFCGRRLTIEQKLSVEISLDENTGNKLWDGAYLLARLIEDQLLGIDVSGKRCIELGAGTGLVSCVAHLAGAKEVVATDLPACLPLLRNNLEVNKLLSESTVTIRALIWGQPNHAPLDDRGEKWDLVLGSDIVYHPESVSPLLSTLAYLMTSSSEAVICYKTRGLGEAKFFQLAAEQNFCLERLTIPSLPDYRRPEHELLRMTLNEVS